MIRLIQNEQMKMYTRIRSWIMLSFLIVSVLLVGVLMKYYAGAGAGLSHVLLFMNSVQFLSMLVFIFTIIVAGDSVSSEFSWGTIKMLLIRPASRTSILWAKYMSVLLFMLTQLLLLFAVTLIVGLILFGFSALLPDHVTFGASVSSYVFSAIEIAMAATLAFMISAVFRSSSFAIGLSIFLMLTSSVVLAALIGFGYDWARYLLFANTDLSPYFTNRAPIIEGMTLGFSVGMLLIYWVLFMFVSWLSFTKRDIAGN